MVSMSCCMERLSPPSSVDAPCLVFLMSLMALNTIVNET